MALSTIQKISLLFGVLLVWSDQISDIYVGIMYHQHCHYTWSRVNLILAALPAIICFCHVILDGIDKCRENKKNGLIFIFVSLCLTILLPFSQIYWVIKVILNAEDRLITIKKVKSAEIAYEAIPQFIFNCVLRTCLGLKSEVNWSSFSMVNTFFSYMPVISIGISYFGIVWGLSDICVLLYAKINLPNFSQILRGTVIVIPDITLKLCMIILSCLLFGKINTIQWIMALLWILFVCVFVAKLIVQTYWSKKDSGFKFDFLYILDLMWFTVTNLPALGTSYNLSDKYLKRTVRMNKWCTYITLGIILSVMCYVNSSPNTYNALHLKGQIEFNCNHLCESNEAFLEVQEFCPAFNYSSISKINDPNIDVFIEKCAIDEDTPSWIIPYLMNKTEIDNTNLIMKKDYCSLYNLSSHGSMSFYISFWIWTTFILLIYNFIDLILDFLNYSPSVIFTDQLIETANNVENNVKETNPTKASVNKNTKKDSENSETMKTEREKENENPVFEGTNQHKTKTDLQSVIFEEETIQLKVHANNDIKIDGNELNETNKGKYSYENHHIEDKNLMQSTSKMTLTINVDETNLLLEKPTKCQ